MIDEALAVGDAYFTQKCMRFLRQFMKKGTLLFVSHDNSAVTNLCQNAVWLHQGQVKIAADAKTVCERYFEGLYSENQHVEQNTESDEKAAIDKTSSKVKFENEYVDGRLAYLNSTPAF